MSFVTYQPDLLDTVFAPQSPYFQEIRDYLVAEIKTVAPGWLDNRKGMLGELWDRDDLYATCYLIWLAMMLKLMSDSIEQVSLVRLRGKFKALLYAREPKFSEYRAELEVGWYLADKVKSLVIEPLALKEGNTDLSLQAKSPEPIRG